MKKIFVLAFAASLCLADAVAQTVKVQFYTPEIVRVVKSSPNQTVEQAEANKKTEVVILAPEKVKLSQKSNGQTVTYKSNRLTVTVDNQSGAVSFATAKGEKLVEEGAFAFTPISEGIDKGAYKVKQGFKLAQDEPIYGLGLLQNMKMSQRGENRLMMQSNLEDYSNFFQSIKGYGIYWDNYSPTQITDGDELALESQVGNLVDYYFIYGGDADGVIKEMRHLTGEVPMLPLWTYGYHQSRERYKSAAQLLEVLHKYRELNVPIDGMIQDWQYWGSNYTWNAMEFLADDFANAQQMIDEVHNQNAHLTISIWQSFGPMTKGYAELQKTGHLMHFQTWPQSGISYWPPRMDYPSGVRCLDVYSDEARDIYWNNLSRLHDMDIDGWWMDSTDPDHNDYKDSDLDEKTAMGSWRSVRNIYPLKGVSGVFDHQRAIDSNKRIFILTRSYFAGQQRYGANTWSGDISSNWDSFRKQIPICLNYTLTANPNVNTDIGGFFANAYNKTNADNSATRNPQYQELYTRWMQFGLFCPMMRSHGTEVFREIYYYGKEGEPIYDALKSAIEMRYTLLPYIYSTSWQVSKNDDSFMRALMMDFKGDKNTWDNNREFMFGHSFLVCPVVDPLYTEEKIFKTDENSGWNKKQEEASEWPAADWSASHKYNVYLPAGAKWYDYWTNTIYDGGQTLAADAPIAHSPLYVKAGSIIPMSAVMQYSDMKKWDNLDLNVYPGADAEFTLYEDEGDNYNYENGAYSTIKLKWNDRSKTLSISARQGSFEGMIESRTFNVKVAGGSTKSVTYTGKALNVKM